MHHLNDTLNQQNNSLPPSSPSAPIHRILFMFKKKDNIF